MIYDVGTLVSNAQVVTASAASTDYFDTGANIRLGTSDVYFEVALTAISGTSPTITVAIQGSVDAAFTTPVQLAAVTPTVASGVPQLVSVDASPGKALRYYRLYYTVGGTTPSFTITAGPVLDPQVDYQQP